MGESDGAALNAASVSELVYLRDWLRDRIPLDDPGLLALDWAIRELGGPLPTADDVAGILKGAVDG